MLIEQILSSDPHPDDADPAGSYWRGLVNREAGIVNIGLEGKMLLGAFVAVVASSATQSWMTGLSGGCTGQRLCGSVVLG